MKNMKVKVIIAAFGMIILLFGCGSSSEAEETITEEIVEEISETEIEEEPAETEEEAADVEEVTEEDITAETTETETIDEDTMAALKEALDPDVHLLYDELGDAMLMPTSSITFDEQAEQAISTLYELVYKEGTTLDDEAGIQITGDNVKVMAGYYYRESISKEEYYEAIFDTEYYDTLLASLVDGTHAAAADTTGTYYVVPSTDTTGTTGSGSTGTTGSGSTGSTGTTGSSSGTDAAVETYDEPDEDGVWDISGVTVIGADGVVRAGEDVLTDGSQYGNEGSDDGLTPENTTIR